MGNQAVQRSLPTNADKLKAGSTGKAFPRFGYDFSRVPIYGQEADRIADRVIATPTYSAVSSAPTRIPRFSGQSTGHIDTMPASVDQTLANPGSPLEPELREDMGQRFGYDFSRLDVYPSIAPALGVLEQPRFASTYECRPPYPPRHRHGPATEKSTLVPQVCSWPRRSRGECCVTKPSTGCISELRASSEATNARTEARAARRQCGEWLQFSFSASACASVTCLPTAAACTVGSGDPIGGGQIIGEVTEGGVAARIILSYADIGITPHRNPRHIIAASTIPRRFQRWPHECERPQNRPPPSIAKFRRRTTR